MNIGMEYHILKTLVTYLIENEDKLPENEKIDLEKQKDYIARRIKKYSRTEF